MFSALKNKAEKISVLFVEKLNKEILVHYFLIKPCEYETMRKLVRIL